MHRKYCNNKKLLYTLFAAVAAVIMISIFPVETQAAQLAVNEANFPDPAFRNYIAKTVDQDSDGVLSEEEIQNTIRINVSSTNIMDLKGIEYFKSLETLHCENNQLTSLSLGKLESLKILNCSNNQLTALDISGCPQLTDLDFHDNQLTKCNVRNNTELIYLTMFNNRITELDISKNTQLSTKQNVASFNNPLTLIKLNLLSIQSSVDFLAMHVNLTGGNYISSSLSNITLKSGYLYVTDKTKPANYSYTLPDWNNGTPIQCTVLYVDPSNDFDNEDEEKLDTTVAERFFDSYTCTSNATNSTVRLYANGKGASSPESKNYKSCILYTDITASYCYKTDKKGIVRPSTGKVIAGITSTNEKPEPVKGKIVDAQAAKVAKASIKSGQITVTAQKEPGTVYLWVIDTGNAGASACCPVTIKPAPTTTTLYDIPDTDTNFSYGNTKSLKKAEISIGEPKKIYLYPTRSQDKTPVKVPAARYTASINAVASDYFSIVQSDSDPHCFEINAKKLKNNKRVSGKITFTCIQTGKKTTLNVSAVNNVKSISIENPSGLTIKDTHAISIPLENGVASSGTFQMATSCTGTGGTTDNLKFYAMGNAEGYDETMLKNGKVKITVPCSTLQKKIKMKLNTDKKTVTVNAAKGTPKDTTVYYLAVYNTYSSDSGKGYTVISVTAE